MSATDLIMAPSWIVVRAVARTIGGFIGGFIGGVIARVIARVIAIAITVAMSSPCWPGSAEAHVLSTPATASASASAAAAAVAAPAVSGPRRRLGTGTQTETRTATGIATGTATGSATGTATTPVMPRITDEDIRRAQRETRTPTPADIEVVRRRQRLQQKLRREANSARSSLGQARGLRA